jgi:hypothetical protein
VNACRSRAPCAISADRNNYGKSTIGSRADIEKVPATSLKRFYKKYYRPDNAVLIIAGKFEAPATPRSARSPSIRSTPPSSAASSRARW